MTPDEAKAIYDAVKKGTKQGAPKNVSIAPRPDGTEDMTIGVGGEERMWRISKNGEIKEIMHILKGHNK